MNSQVTPPLTGSFRHAVFDTSVTNAQPSGAGNASVRPAADADEPVGLPGTTGRHIGAAVVRLATIVGTVAALWPLMK
jgi:hypothetical protein